ncbi:sugar ABC transporter permease [Streptomyces sp. WAC 00631]|uniref:carbohydrate ABC transporter permease n=1 Tax=unclassified Streptomyces TaxID=2593676 RepID=UPI000F796BD9|nr:MULTISPECIES: sugar ABC transporter permease [unclassified Streptomyces]MCC5035954.1 sugar ABC transporter permease [Streptomyces sp. WAC 00631]MCC9739006.1 sugar ABC transporter permease [Streptomyces sp. MNU89]
MTTLTAPPKTPPPPVRTRKSSGAAAKWKRRIPLLPALIFTIVVTQLPFVATLIISTFQWNILRPGERHFVGLSNFSFVFTDERLRTAVLNTVVLTASVVIISVILGLGLAMLLDRRFAGRGLARTLLIAPFLVMPVAAALLWKHAIYNPDYGLLNGTLNAVYRLFGADNGPTVDWISSYPMPAVVVSLVWQWTPFMMLILLAGLQAQPGDVLEAARMDGASALQTFRHITLPHLRRYIELGVLLGTIYVVQTFDAVFTITQGGPGSQTTNLPYEIYLTMFRKYEYGEAAAAGVVVVLGAFVIATFALRTIASLFREETSR